MSLFDQLDWKDDSAPAENSQFGTLEPSKPAGCSDEQQAELAAAAAADTGGGDDGEPEYGDYGGVTLEAATDDADEVDADGYRVNKGAPKLRGEEDGGGDDEGGMSREDAEQQLKDIYKQYAPENLAKIPGLLDRKSVV